ncbi:MAG: hypothetical protein KC656_27365, partial [Myxococcales bacterium]|nr:hypothetical protein [Myxococcales bacterium]
MWFWGSAEATTTAEIQKALDGCGTLSTPLPSLSEDQLRDLAGSKVLRLLFRAADDEPSTAVGIAVLEGSV